MHRQAPLKSDYLIWRYMYRIIVDYGEIDIFTVGLRFLIFCTKILYNVHICNDANPFLEENIYENSSVRRRE
jgi:hypothetical protein